MRCQTWRRSPEMLRIQIFAQRIGARNLLVRREFVLVYNWQSHWKSYSGHCLGNHYSQMVPVIETQCEVATVRLHSDSLLVRSSHWDGQLGSWCFTLELNALTRLAGGPCTCMVLDIIALKMVINMYFRLLFLDYSNLTICIWRSAFGQARPGRGAAIDCLLDGDSEETLRETQNERDCETIRRMIQDSKRMSDLRWGHWKSLKKAKLKHVPCRVMRRKQSGGLGRYADRPRCAGLRPPVRPRTRGPTLSQKWESVWREKSD